MWRASFVVVMPIRAKRAVRWLLHIQLVSSCEGKGADAEFGRAIVGRYARKGE